VSEEGADRANAPAGWYSDPAAPDTSRRYWDGQEWTDSYAPAASDSYAPAASDSYAPAASDSYAPAAGGGLKGVLDRAPVFRGLDPFGRLAVAALAAALAVAVLILLSSGSDYGCREDVESGIAQSGPGLYSPSQIDQIVDACIEVREECEDSGRTDCENAAF